MGTERFITAEWDLGRPYMYLRGKETGCSHRGRVQVQTPALTLTYCVVLRKFLLSKSPSSFVKRE